MCLLKIKVCTNFDGNTRQETDLLQDMGIGGSKILKFI